MLKGWNPGHRVRVYKLPSECRVPDIVEARIEHRDMTGVVGGVNVVCAAAAGDRERRVHGAGHGRNRHRRGATVPAKNSSIQGIKQKVRRAAVRQIETGVAIEHLPRWPGRESYRRDAHNQWNGVAVSDAWFEIQNGELTAKAMPHGFFKFGS
jgi:hypothetical protein